MSSSSSSDTDIDEIVDEFEQRRLAAVAHALADDQLIDIRCASDVTHRQAVRAVAAFSTSALVLFAVMLHAPRPGNYYFTVSQKRRHPFYFCNNNNKNNNDRFV